MDHIDQTVKKFNTTGAERREAQAAESKRQADAAKAAEEAKIEEKKII